MGHRNTNRFLNPSYLLFSFFFIMVFIIGCSVAYSNGEKSENILTGTKVMVTITATPMPTRSSSTATFTSTATSFPTETPSPVSSPTATIETTPTKMPTVSPTPMPTWTPLPTFAPSQRGQIYDELMNSNGGCTLPCWWGFELGKTSLNEVRQFYARFGTYITEQHNRNDITIIEVLFVDPQIENGIQVVHSFIAQNDVIIESQIPLINRPEYQIEPILQSLGKPAEVRMLTRIDPVEGLPSTRLPARFYLYFPEKGVFLSYTTGGYINNDSINICFNEIGGTTLHLWKPEIWNPNGDKGFDERLNESSEAILYPEYRAINEISNWDVERFYSVLSNTAHTECLETPSNLWSAP